MVGILVSFWDGLFSGAVSFREGNPDFGFSMFVSEKNIATYAERVEFFGACLAPMNLGE